MQDYASLPSEIAAIIQRALEEDLGAGDVTTLRTVPADMWLSGRILARQHGIVAGLEVAGLVFALLDERVVMLCHVEDGQSVAPMQTLAELRGPGRALLSGERTALNLLQRMSGIASITSKYVNAVEGTGAVILDTRKTAPGLRLLDKLAVRMGGGQNHRFGLYDMALIKNNHIAAVGGSLEEAVRRVRSNSSGTDSDRLQVEIEVRSLEELQIALKLDVDRILLDNMDVKTLRQAVALTGRRIPLEASGGITLENVAQVAATGVDYVSVGALTHSAQALDISLWLDETPPNQ